MHPNKIPLGEYNILFSDRTRHGMLRKLRLKKSKTFILNILNQTYSMVKDASRAGGKTILNDIYWANKNL